MKLTLRKTVGMDDWYVIERAEHDGREWVEQIGPNSFSLCCSSRFSDADVEGHPEEMLAIAAGIQGRRYVSFKRCAVDARTEPVTFWSPRNSQKRGEVTYAEAADLARLIHSILAQEELG